MTPERWQRVQEIFHQASELEQEERLEFVKTACGDDTDLCDEVLTLIRSGDTGGDFIEDAIGGTAQRAVAAEPKEDAGERIGAYRIIDTLGRGGMGVVYLAERADKQFEQRVAIKLVRSGLLVDDSIAVRLRSERQILASLEHPNVARLLDGGATEDGVPYLVIEYINGKPITEYCDEKALPISKRLELFRTVCSAVQHAHRNLIVHRDLKPSNILVTPEGVPKLLDFGIAKILDASRSTHTVAVTQAELRLMTPEHASPEQVLGRPITTATDVYALGILLYELLTGYRPFRITGTRVSEMEKIICEKDPTPPSVAVLKGPADGRTDELPPAMAPDALAHRRRSSPDRLRRELSGDLDNIILMALRKEPERRYASVEQFSEDVRRYLADLPVAACGDTWAYRAEKFVRRHVVGVSMAAVAVVLLTGFSVAMSIQRNIAIEARERAELQEREAKQEQARAEQVTSFLVESFKAADPERAQGETITAKEILDRGRERINQELSDQPELQARLKDTIGRVYHALGLYDEAETMLGEALQTRRKLAESGGERDDLSALASSYNALARNYREQARYNLAHQYHQRAVKIYEQLFGEDRPDPSVAEVLDDLGLLESEQGNFSKAQALYQQSLGMYRSLPGQHSNAVARVSNHIGQVMQFQGNNAEAEQWFRDALSISSEHLKQMHPDVIEYKHNLAVVLHAQGKLAEAEPLYRQVIESVRKVRGEEHTELAAYLGNYGRLLQHKGDYGEAEKYLQEALRVDLNALREDHPHVAYDKGVLAVLWLEMGKLDEAEGLLQEVLAAYQSALAPDHRLATALISLARLQLKKGDPTKANELVLEAREICVEVLGEDHYLTAYTNSVLAETLVAKNQFTEAEPLLLDAYQKLSEQLGESDRLTRRALNSLFILYDAWGKPEQAAKYAAIEEELERKSLR